MEEGLARLKGAEKARYWMRIATIATGIIVAILAFSSGNTWAGVLAVLFAYNSAQAIRGLPQVRIKG